MLKTVSLSGSKKRSLLDVSKSHGEVGSVLRQALLNGPQNNIDTGYDDLFIHEWAIVLSNSATADGF